jgi:hypothetical protein
MFSGLGLSSYVAKKDTGAIATRDLFHKHFTLVIYGATTFFRQTHYQLTFCRLVKYDGHIFYCKCYKCNYRYGNFTIINTVNVSILLLQRLASIEFTNVNFKTVKFITL